MYTRLLKTKLLKYAKDFPVITLIGPRQSGKTSLVKESFPNKPYINFEDPEMRLLAQEEPRQLFKYYILKDLIEGIGKHSTILRALSSSVFQKFLA